MKVDSASDKQMQVSNDVAPTSWKKVRRRINIIEKMPMLFVSAQSRACLRVAAWKIGAASRSLVCTAQILAHSMRTTGTRYYSSVKKSL